MIFHVDNHMFRISFKHEFFNPPITIPANADEHSPYKSNTVHARTTCFIVKLTGTKDHGTRELVAQGVTHCAVTENFDKAVGREWAFWRALKAASPHPNKMWEMAIKAYSQSGAHRPDKEMQTLAAAA